MPDSLWTGRLQSRIGGWAGRALFSLPTPLLARLAGTPPPHAEGLHPEAWLLARLSAVGPGHTGDEVPVAEQRRRLALEARPLAIRPRLPLDVSDHAIPGPAGPIPARLYAPPATPGPRGPDPPPPLRPPRRPGARAVVRVLPRRRLGAGLGGDPRPRLPPAR